MVDALGLNGDEGRTSLRKATVSWQEAITRGLPNQETALTVMLMILIWIHSIKRQYVAKWNISVATGKENNVIPSVVASERGEGQTNFELGLWATIWN